MEALQLGAVQLEQVPAALLCCGEVGEQHYEQVAVLSRLLTQVVHAASSTDASDSHRESECSQRKG